jgi:hypothetical protein
LTNGLCSALTLGATLTCIGPVAAAGSRASFPGGVDRLRSPDGRYVVRWVEAKVGHDHQLLLSQGQNETRLLSFPRGVDVLWSPSGNRLAVTNHRASDESTVLLWPDIESAAIDLLEELAAQEGQSAKRWGTHHLYLTAIRWRDAERLEVRLFGYGDATVERRYLYSIGRGFAAGRERLAR